MDGKSSVKIIYSGQVDGRLSRRHPRRHGTTCETIIRVLSLSRKNEYDDALYLDMCQVTREREVPALV